MMRIASSFNNFAAAFGGGRALTGSRSSKKYNYSNKFMMSEVECHDNDRFYQGQEWLFVGIRQLEALEKCEIL